MSKCCWTNIIHWYKDPWNWQWQHLQNHISKKQSSELPFRQFECCYFKLEESETKVNILLMTSLFRRKSITKCENVITFHHDKNHHNSLHFPRWFSPFIFVERTGIWVGDHFLESIGKIHIILLAFFDPSKVWSPGPESTRYICGETAYITHRGRKHLVGYIGRHVDQKFYIYV